MIFTSTHQVHAGLIGINAKVYFRAKHGLDIFFFASQQGKVVKSNSGFSGRGFKFDETEEAMAKERKQIQKAALGLADSDEDEPAQNVSALIKNRSEF